MSSFLFELGLEEIPARMIAAAQDELVRRTVALLKRERLVAEDVQAVGYSTPRRLAVRVSEVSERQADLTEDVLGPAVKIAYKDGVPGPAAVAFAKKAGVEVEALRTVDTPKGEYVAATSTRAGRSAAEILAAELPKELGQIYWAKNMYWRPGKPERFVRPVQWIVALLGAEVVPVEFGGYAAGRLTYGHRVLHGAGSIVLGAPEGYLEALTGASLMADVELRRHTIRKALDHVCRTLPGARWREDHELVDKMTHLTEWPAVLAGSFDADFLALPEEVLVTVMRDHQNYFAVQDADGKLAPHFLAVLNTSPTAAGAAIIRHGNERVLRARFSDARFFWEFDARVPMEDRVALLEKVTFQKDLGSYGLKTERVQAIAQDLGRQAESRGVRVDHEALWTASRLAKADLTTELVKEFTELQGQIGGLYAAAQGAPQAAADAIYDQYRPASMEDRIPRTVEGQILAVADRIDTIAGMFGLGLEPTGSKDPFALRRAANGIVRIVAEGALPLKLSEIVALPETTPEVAGKITGFFAERLDFYLREARGQAYDVVKAVLAVGADDVRDAVARAEAVTAVREADAATFAAVSAGLKRMRNILDQARAKGEVFGVDVKPELLMAGAEEELASTSKIAGERIAEMRMRGEYGAALAVIAGVRPQIDGFFEDVVVMDSDLGVRANRLALLGRILREFGGIADFSEIVVAG